MSERRLVLQRDEGAEGWSGTAEVGPGDGAVGRAGPAGVVHLDGEDVSFTMCFLTGRVESVWLPDDRSEADDALVDAMAAAVELGGARGSAGIIIRPLADRRALARWARLEADRIDGGPFLGEGTAAAAALAVERAAAASSLDAAVADALGVDVDEVVERALEATAVGGLAPDPSRNEADREAAEGALRRWGLEVARLRTGAAADLAGRLVPPGLPSFRGMLGADRQVAGPVFNGLPERAWPEAAAQDDKLREARAGDPATGVGYLPVDADGWFSIDETSARRSDLVAGRAQVEMLERGWYRIRLALAPEASREVSRWALATDGRGAILGAAPLVGIGPDAFPAEAVAHLAVSGPFEGVRFGVHPFRRPDAPLLVVDEALDAARLAVRRSEARLAGLDAAWATSAMCWLDCGSIHRAAWAWRDAAQGGASIDLLREAGIPDPEATERVLAAVRDAGHLRQSSAYLSADWPLWIPEAAR